MRKKESVPNRRYTEEFKIEAVRLADSIGGNAGSEKAGDTAVDDDELGSAKTRGRRRLQAAGAARQSSGRYRELEAENARLRRELVNAKLDLEIVKKAAAYFVKESR